MRNTPYPRYTIGNKNHKVFDLDPNRGLVQGITDISDLVEIKASDLSSFEHTPPGQVKVFDTEQKVEIVSFGGYHNRGDFVSKLETQLLTLEAGAKLTGPVAWRIADERNAPINPKAESETTDRGTVAMFIVFLAMVGLIAFLAPGAAVALVGILTIIGLGLWIGALSMSGKHRNIAKMGSIYVYTPTARTWAA